MSPDQIGKLSGLIWNGNVDDNGLQVLAKAAAVLWPSTASSFEDIIRGLILELGQLRSAGQQQAKATSENTTALIENTAAQLRQTGGSAAAARAIGGIISSGLGMAPVLGALARLFRPSEQEKVSPLVKYIGPPTIHFEGVVSRLADYRSEGNMPGNIHGIFPGEWPVEANRTGFEPRTVNITVQVHAMDSRSFVEHSWEIAQAVKEAMLEAHALNDVVMEL